MKDGLHILVRHRHGGRWKVIHSQAADIEEQMTRNHTLHWMLAKIAEIFPDDRQRPPSRLHDVG